MMRAVQPQAPWFSWALAAACVCAPASGRAQALQRFALRLEGGAGALLSAYQRNDDPSQFQGNAPGYSLTAQGTARLAVRLAGPLVLQASVSNWVFPSGRAGTGWVFAPMGGVRVEPRLGSAGRLFVDGNVGAAFTGEVVRVQVDVGLGVELDVSRWFSLGPVVRYGQTIQPDERDGRAEPFPDDARYVTGGISMSLRAPEPVVHPEVGGDRDGDEVRDGDDLCPSVPRGATPDPARPGCPTPDLDGDGVFDVDDACVSVASGARPDPARRGCPDGDSDHDGFVEHDDQCPDVPAGAHADPARPGCPEADRDGDGYVDRVDGCPEAAETFNNFRDEDGCPERDVQPLVEVQQGMIRLVGDPIVFATLSDRIVGRRSYQTLDALAAVLRAHTEIARVDVQGHTDDRGAREMNRDLSTRRARAVRAYLVDHGVAAERVEAHGYGSSRPVVSNDTLEGQSINRRVEIHIVRLVENPDEVRAPIAPPTETHP